MSGTSRLSIYLYSDFRMGSPQVGPHLGLHCGFACPRWGTPRASPQPPCSPGGDIAVKPEVFLTPPGYRIPHISCLKNRPDCRAMPRCPRAFPFVGFGLDVAHSPVLQGVLQSNPPLTKKCAIRSV